MDVLTCPCCGRFAHLYATPDFVLQRYLCLCGYAFPMVYQPTGEVIDGWATEWEHRKAWQARQKAVETVAAPADNNP